MDTKHGELDKILRFMIAADNAKEEIRSGWIAHKISSRPEHVADHIFSLALLSRIFAKRKGLDVGRCVEMALIHDLHEAISGDIPSRTYKKDWVITPEEKRRVEEEDTMKILSLLPASDARHMRELWKEYAQQKTKEAKLVKEMDMLDIIIQAVVYSNNVNDRKRFLDFFVDAKRKLKNKDLIYIMERARKEVFGK